MIAPTMPTAQRPPGCCIVFAVNDCCWRAWLPLPESLAILNALTAKNP
jgi:hypothetical protein